VAAGADRAAVARAVGWIAPALEIVETRGPFSRQLALALADNGQQRAFVVGRETDPSGVPDLATVQATVVVNGRVVGSGTGDAVLGHPYESIAWLAARLPDFGETLRPGDVVMTGSFTRQFPIAAGDRVETRFEGLGVVAATFD
ncbi:MAG: 2-keto-4-pentenoate hydratase, partial [Alphaproteobacteria bacterium]